MGMDLFALKGNILYTPQKKELAALPDAYVVCREGFCEGIYQALPNEYKDICIVDFGDALIIPGMVDLHIHAPQYAFRGTGMDCELLEWLKTYTFPEEARYADKRFKISEIWAIHCTQRKSLRMRGRRSSPLWMLCAAKLSFL